MPLDLPGELAGLAAALGLSWPEADEDALHALAAGWIAVSETLAAGAADSAVTVRQLLDTHPGDLDAFGAAWSGGPARQFDEAVLAAQALATCLTTMAAVVLELKAFAMGRLAALVAHLAADPANLAGHTWPTAGVATGPPYPNDPANPGDPAGGPVPAVLAAQAAAAIATRAALRRAESAAANVIDGSLVPALHAAERHLRRALTPTALR